MASRDKHHYQMAQAYLKMSTPPHIETTETTLLRGILHMLLAIYEQAETKETIDD